MIDEITFDSIKCFYLNFSRSHPNEKTMYYDLRLLVFSRVGVYLTDHSSIEIIFPFLSLRVYLLW